MPLPMPGMLPLRASDIRLHQAGRVFQQHVFPLAELDALTPLAEPSAQAASYSSPPDAPQYCALFCTEKWVSSIFETRPHAMVQPKHAWVRDQVGFAVAPGRYRPSKLCHIFRKRRSMQFVVNLIGAACGSRIKRADVFARLKINVASI